MSRATVRDGAANRAKTAATIAAMNRPTLALIAAVARNGAIGRNNDLLWREADDQRHFRRVTMGCPVVMGSTTWGSLPDRFRPLPGRRNVVITRQAGWQAPGAEAAAVSGTSFRTLPPLEGKRGGQWQVAPR